MTNISKLSEAASMGIHAMLFLAANPGKTIQLREIAERIAVSEAHLAKVFQRLGKAGYVSATRGPAGGYVLADKNGETTLLEVFEAIDGPIHVKFCMFSEPVCVDQCCGLGELLAKQTLAIKEFLAKTKLKDAQDIFKKGAKGEKKNS